MNLLNCLINLFRLPQIRKEKDSGFRSKLFVTNAVCAYNQWFHRSQLLILLA